MNKFKAFLCKTAFFSPGKHVLRKRLSSIGLHNLNTILLEDFQSMTLFHIPLGAFSKHSIGNRLGLRIQVCEEMCLFQTLLSSLSNYLKSLLLRLKQIEQKIQHFWKVFFPVEFVLFRFDLFGQLDGQDVVFAVVVSLQSGRHHINNNIKILMNHFNETHWTNKSWVMFGFPSNKNLSMPIQLFEATSFAIFYRTLLLSNPNSTPKP